MKPVVDGLKKRYEGKVEFRLYNVETDKEGLALAEKMNLQYVPTFLFVDSKGVIAKQMVGEQTEADLVSNLSALQ